MTATAQGGGIEQRIFVVGVPRSGTTLVQSLLAAHTEVTSFTESHLFDRHFRPLPFGGAVLTRSPAARLREFLTENGEEPPAAAEWFDGEGRRALEVRALLPLATGRVARRLLAVLDELALGRGRRRWVEKTPRHLRYIPLLERAAGGGPAPRFVHVIRDGLEVVASLREASKDWQRPYDLATCVRRWNADVGLSLRRAGMAADRFVFYEELAARPEPTLRRLLDGLGLGWEPAILERYAAASRRLVSAREEGWKTDIGREISPSRTSGRALTADERRRVARALRGGLYERLRGAARAAEPGAAG